MKTKDKNIISGRRTGFPGHSTVFTGFAATRTPREGARAPREVMHLIVPARRGEPGEKRA
jgi:hypothetical protein